MMTKVTHSSAKADEQPIGYSQLEFEGGLTACLPASLQKQLEAIFSADLSAVRIHQGPQAGQVNAAAFAFGSDIFFAPGQFQPETMQGLQLLGHELTHVLQQCRGQVKGRRPCLTVVEDHELEMEADRMGWLAAKSLRLNDLNSLSTQLSWQPSHCRDWRRPRHTSAVIQRRFFIGKEGFSSHDNNLGPLEAKIISFAATRNVSEVRQTLTRFDFQNRRFKNLARFISALNEDILLDRYEKGDPIPKCLHHFWAGGALSAGAFFNLHSWLVKASAAGWDQYILTDSVVNNAFGKTGLEGQLEALQMSGSVVVDMAQLPFSSKAVYEQLRNAVVTQGLKSKLPYLSDLARYAQLLVLGGLYVDVDVSPGQVNMKEILTCIKGIPQLGPCFRTEGDARLHGYFDPLESARILATVMMYSSNKLAIGNHFIAAPARNAVIARANEIATAQVNKHQITNGGNDFLKAFCSLEDLGPDAIQASLPAWAADVEWVTPESNSTVD